MLNRVVIVGRLTRDLELRYTQDKIAVVSFTVAIDRPKIGDKKDADFINCTAWRHNAEFAAKYAVKGALVGVDGRLQTRSWESKDGKKNNVTEVLVEEFKIYEYKKGVASANNTNNSKVIIENKIEEMVSTGVPKDEAIQMLKSDDIPLEDTIVGVEVTDDDLPF